MVSYTTVGKQHICPMWNIKLTITGKYYFFDDNNPYIAKYVSCKCPILENLKLPTHKQSEEYSLFRFCKLEQECLNNVEFKPNIDIRKDGYSQ